MPKEPALLVDQALPLGPTEFLSLKATSVVPLASIIDCSQSSIRTMEIGGEVWDFPRNVPLALVPYVRIYPFPTPQPAIPPFIHEHFLLRVIFQSIMKLIGSDWFTRDAEYAPGKVASMSAKTRPKSVKSTGQCNIYKSKDQTSLLRCSTFIP